MPMPNPVEYFHLLVSFCFPAMILLAYSNKPRLKKLHLFRIVWHPSSGLVLSSDPAMISRGELDP